MKNNFLKIIPILLVIFVLSSFNIHDNEKDKILVGLITQTLQVYHYKNIEIDDDFSKNVYNTYIEYLDYGKRFLLKSDIRKLNKYEHKIDDEISARTFNFFELSFEIINDRIEEVEQYYKEILSKPFDFELDETIELDPEKRDFCNSEKELYEHWRKYLKLTTLQKLHTLIKRQDKAEEKNDTTYEHKSFKELEQESRDEILNSYDNYFHRLSKLNRDDRFSIYLNSVSSIFGPHTQYLPPKQKEDFDISMSGKLEGIGATLTEKDGYIQIVKIVPGSACWKQGELEVDDKIVKVAQADSTPVSVVDMRLDDAVRLIRGKKGTEVRLSIEKIDGSLKIIPIIRDVVLIEETYAKSIIVTDKDSTIKIGYIYLPQFYADFNDRNGKRCATDVKNEIIKLKAAGIDGIIFDLRNNGGGSLQDAIDISGLFIEKGPVVQVKGRNRPKEIYKDRDKSILYDGPLLIMVNMFSASASEILAAAMQDYHRAVIFGSKSTHGKGTVQRFVDFDRFSKNENVKPLGVIKLTTQKFYRINGGATQLRGVTPDIIFPNTYTYIEDTGEKELDFALEWDKIQPASYETWNRTYDLDEIIHNSQYRMENDSVFTLIDENAKRVKVLRDETLVSLNLKTYQKEEEENKIKAEKYKKANKHKTDLNFYLLPQDIYQMEQDTLKNITLQKDIYIKEALFIIKDMQ